MYPPMYPPPMTPVVQWTNANGQMPSWFGPFMMSLMNFRRDILERMNTRPVVVQPQPQAYHFENNENDDEADDDDDKDSEEETAWPHGPFPNGPLPYVGPYGPHQPFGPAPYQPHVAQPYGPFGPMPYGDYVPTHPKKIKHHKKKKYHSHAEPEPEPYHHVFENDYSQEESSDEESGELKNRKVITLIELFSDGITLKIYIWFRPIRHLKHQ